MREYDFAMSEGVQTIFFKHVRGAVFEFWYVIDNPALVCYYDFETCRHKIGESSWYNQPFPFPNKDYKRWLFKQQLKEMLSE